MSKSVDGFRGLTAREMREIQALGELSMSICIKHLAHSQPSAGTQQESENDQR